MGVVNEMELKILITGSNGQLGQKLTFLCLNKNIPFLATANTDNKFSKCPENNFRILDITDKQQVMQTVLDFRPTHIINTAAMTNVDACETEIEKCCAINHYGVKNILDATKDTDIHIIQISTDFIFDGKKKTYSEDDLPNPLGEYGKSKLAGEKALLESGYKYYTILRTSILYGTGENLNKSNIFNWAMKELRAKNIISIVDDQFRTPTFVEDLAQACITCIEKSAFGIYNIAGKDLHSMYEFILMTAEYVKADKSLVKAISSKILNQKAVRPQSSGLLIDKAKKDLGYYPTDFIKSLSKIDTLNKKSELK